MTVRELRDIRTVERIVFEGAFANFDFTYARLPPWSAREYASTSTPFAIDFAFTTSPRAVVQRPGKGSERRDIPAMSGGAVGAEPFDWIETGTISEFVELRPCEQLRSETAELYGRDGGEPYSETFARTDPFLFLLASRLRAHALGGDSVSDLEGDFLAILALENTIERLGVRRPRGSGAKLDNVRMNRIRDFVEAHVADALTLEVLASVAAVSRHHFAVMFRRTTGLTPHAYVTALRMQRAREALDAGASVERTAGIVGYAPAHQFRTTFRKAFGVLPNAIH